MAVNQNASTTKVVKERKLYTGLANMQVVAVNPTKAEMEKMGMSPKNDPVYTKEEDGVTKTRLDIYLSREESEAAPAIKAKMALWLEDKLRVSGAGNNEYLNKFGQSAWAKPGEEPEYDWFKKEGLRQAFDGEERVIDFLKNWANVESEGECTLETIEKIVKGDVTELNDLARLLKDNYVRVLLGVQTSGSNQYQAVYTKMFDRPYNTKTARWIAKLNDQYGEFKNADWQGDLMLKEYTGATSIEEETPSDLAGSAAGSGQTKNGELEF